MIALTWALAATTVYFLLVAIHQAGRINDLSRRLRDLGGSE